MISRLNPSTTIGRQTSGRSRSWLGSSVAALCLLWSPLAQADDPVNGASLYNANCSGCHGATPQTVDQTRIGYGRNSRASLDVAMNLPNATKTGLRPSFPSGGSKLADIAAYLGSLPSSLSFASTAVGSTSATQTITVYPSTKTGNGISGLAVASATGEFARSGGSCGTSVAAGGSSCTVEVAFSPVASGARSGTLTLTHGDTLTPISIALSGTATGGSSGPFAGSLDTTFDSDGKAVNSFGNNSNVKDNRGMVVRGSDGTVVVAGSSSDGFKLTMFTSSGALLGTSSNITIGSSATATGLAMQADGKFIVVGYATVNFQIDIAVARFNSNGTVDTSFGTGGFVTTAISTITNNGSPTDQAFAVAIQPDGKIVVVGTTMKQQSNNQAYRDIAAVRYNSTGTLDTSFGTAGVSSVHIGGSGNSQESVGNAVVLQPDGKIVIGATHFPSGNGDFAAVRLLANGSLDTSFNNTGIATLDHASCSPCNRDDGVNGVALQSDGKIVLVGYADNSIRDSNQPNNDTTDINFALARFNADGSLDSSFGSAGKVTTRIDGTPTPGNSTGPNAVAHAVLMQPDGKILVAGENGVRNTSTLDFALLRYNSNGSLDTGFDAAGTGKVLTSFVTGKDGGRAIAMTSDGKIVVAGFSNNASNGPDIAVARYTGTPQVMAATNHRDFNADGKSDIMWQNTSGERAIWYMNGGTFVSGTVFRYVDPSWEIALTADFNGDGKPDIIWQNVNTGERYVWYMDGSTLVSFERITILEPAWRIVGAADFNNDGKPDLLWENSSGRRAIWFLNGITLISALDLGYVSPDWKVAATADFNSDGKPDIVWQNVNNGQRAIWYMNGATLASAVVFFNLETAWSIAGAGDFNNDGKPDLLWQNINGDRAVFYMDGATVIGAVGLFNVSNAWSIIR